MVTGMDRAKIHEIMNKHMLATRDILMKSTHWREAHLEELRRNFEVGHLGSLDTAFEICTTYNLPLPIWLTEALRTEKPKGGKGRANSPAWQAQNAKVHALRWRESRLCLLKMQKSIEEWARLSPAIQLALTQEEAHCALFDGQYPRTEKGAFKMAHDLLKGTSAQGSPERIRESYQKVQAAIKSGTDRVYIAALRYPWPLY